MIIEYILPQESQTRIFRLKAILAEIELPYLERIYKNPSDEKKIREEFINNTNVKSIQDEIADIYKKNVEKILITLETEEEMKEFNENWGVKEKTKAFDKIPDGRIKEIGENETGKIETSTIGIEILNGEEKENEN